MDYSDIVLFALVVAAIFALAVLGDDGNGDRFRRRSRYRGH